MSTPRKLAPPTTPKSKTILKTGVWGHIVGLKKQDESVYYRYPIDKSYCSFGRSDTNDIRVQIDAVSDLHCKLIRRDDGEVWLKDTSINGTLLNNVLVHDTARPIHHSDVMTIAGRKFRFESLESIPRTPFESAGTNTPGRMINNIQKTIDDDIQILAEIPSPTAGRLLLTPKKNTVRSAAALESSLGLFTPNRAAKLSSLLVSPKPVPLPAFLAKSPKRTTTPRKVLTMIDEPSVLNPTYTAVPSEASTSESEPGMQTPPKNKRSIPIEFDDNQTERTPKKVSFGPALSPEVFDKAEPPSTPVKRGQQQGPLTPRRQGVSTPSLLSRLSALKPTAKPILTPSRLNRTSIMHELQKPAPMNLFAPDDASEEQDIIQMPIMTPFNVGWTTTQNGLQQENVTKATQSTSRHEVIASADTKGVLHDENQEQVKVADGQAVEDSGSSSDNSNGSSNSDDGLWNKLVPVANNADAGSSDANILDEDNYDLSLDDFLDEDESPPTTPTRVPLGRIITPIPSTPTRSRRLSNDLVQQDHVHLPLGSIDGQMKNDMQSDDRSLSPSIVANNPLHAVNTNPFEVLPANSEVQRESSPSSYSTPPHRSIDTMDTTPVHTPIRSRASNELQQRDVTPFKSTPNSASRLALLQLSAQKIQGLPDLLQSPGSPSLTTPTRPMMPLSLFDQPDDETLELIDSNARDVNGQNNPFESTTATDIPSGQAKASRELDPKRRSSAPATVDRSQSPIFSGIRGVFRTPQKVVESCFAGFAGIRNFMSPTKLPSFQLPSRQSEAAEEEDNNGSGYNVAKNDDFGDVSKESAVETLHVRENSESIENNEKQLSEDGDTTTTFQKTPTKANTSGSTTTTPKRRVASHQDVMAILLGNPQNLSPKSKEFSFVKEPSMLTPTKSLEQLKARGRRSDIFPQKRTIANRSHSQGADDRIGGKDGQEVTQDSNGVARRRRTISLFEFKKEGSYSSSATLLVTSSSSSGPALEPEDGVETLIEAEKEAEDDAEQAELLRLLGEGAESVNEEEAAEDDEDDDGNKENIDYDAIDDANVDAILYGDDETALSELSQKLSSEPKSPSSRRVSLSKHNRSRDSTPTKRRNSFRQRLGSSSPAFRMYEQQGGELDEDEEDEDDMVVMLSPKRVRVRSFLGDC
ncbi:antigen identified by monoclonal antibody Ki-67 [Mortierella sp. AM989]|nr:antigen identified by monoclonal antibody Ki-67 [Mortierella sp. AM989]